MTIRTAVYAHAARSPLNGQFLAGVRHADEQGMAIVATYTDHGPFAKLQERPGFQRMLNDALQMETFDVALIEKAERLSNNAFEFAYYRRKLLAHGVTLAFVGENNDNHHGPGAILESLMDGMMAYLEDIHGVRLFSDRAADGSGAL